MIGIIKTQDKRFLYLSNYFENVIYSDDILDFNNIDTLILPISGIDRFLFIKDSNINLNDIILNNNIKHIIAGKINDDLKNISIKENIKLSSYLDIPYYAWENAKLTSYLLIKKIINDYDSTLFNLNILIMGYGYCGKAIYNMLKPYCNNISIYCRDSHDIKELYCNNIKYENLKELNKYDIIINTVDFNLINDYMFETLKYDVGLYDISSYPYGFNLDDASKYKFKVNILPKLPSYVPQEAGYILFQTIKKLL